VTLGGSVSTVVTTVAGTVGTAGYANGTGSAAQFSGPFGVATDNAGNIYVADTGNSLIRKIVASSGVVSDFAGSTTVVAGTATSGGVATSTTTLDPGYVDGVSSTDGSGGRLDHPQGLAWANGTLYVADTANSAIRSVDASGTITSFAGGGTPGSGSTGAAGTLDAAGTAAGFDSPRNLVVDGSGNVFVADTGNDLIRKIDSSGNVTTYAGALIPSVTAYFITTTVSVQTTNNSTGAVSNSSSSSTSTVYTKPDTASHSVPQNSTTVDIVTTTTISIDYQYTTPPTASPGSVDGYALPSSGSVAQFRSPRGVALIGGVLYVADGENDDLRQISASSPAVVRTVAGSPGLPGFADGNGAEALLYNPEGIVYYQDPSNSAVSYMFEADAGNHTVRVVKRTQNNDGSVASQTVSTIAGSAGISGVADGTGSAAQFNTPIGVALDPTGSSTGGPVLYVADANNDTIRSLVPGSSDLAAPWQVSTLAGLLADDPRTTSTLVYPKIPDPGITDGACASAQFNFPNGLAVYNHKVYVADTNNNNIREITVGSGASSCTVNTIAGSVSGASGSTVGAATNAVLSARFFYPVGIAADGIGNLYLTEYGNHTVREISYNSTSKFWVAIAVAGVSQTASAVDGTGSTATFSHPIGIAVANSSSGSAHYLYVSDNFNYTVRKIDVSTSDNTVSTVLGVAGSRGFTPGSTPGPIYAPTGLAINPTTAGSVWDLYVSSGDAIIKVASVP